METKNLQILVEEMEEILTRPLFTESDRNDVVSMTVRHNIYCDRSSLENLFFFILHI